MVRLLLLAEALVEPGLVAVERVRVLHDELAQPDEALAGPRLVALLDREVVEHLRKLAVALELARVERDRLLVRHRQDVLRAFAVLEAEELLDEVALRLLPQLERREDGHEHLLRADRVLLLANDLRDLLVDAPAEREERPDAGRDLPDEAAADEQLVRHRVRVGGRFAQGRKEQL